MRSALAGTIRQAPSVVGYTQGEGDRFWCGPYVSLDPRKGSLSHSLRKPRCLCRDIRRDIGRRQQSTRERLHLARLTRAQSRRQKNEQVDRGLAFFRCGGAPPAYDPPDGTGSMSTTLPLTPRIPQNARSQMIIKPRPSTVTVTLRHAPVIF